MASEGVPMAGGGIDTMFILLIIIVGVGIAIAIIVSRKRRKGNVKEPSMTGVGAPVRGVSQPSEVAGGYVKRCPTCQSIFTDETLAFCLSDGSTLERVANPFTSDPNATLVYPSANGGDISPTVPYHPDMLSNKKR
jgi:hypothetical protein